MKDQVFIPRTLSDWRKIYEKRRLQRTKTSAEDATLVAIFGDEFIINTIDLMVSSNLFDESGIVELAPLESVEMFLRRVHSPAVDEHLLSLCFGSNPQGVRVAEWFLGNWCIPDYRVLLPHLSRFSASGNPSLRYTGALILFNGLTAGLISPEETEEVLGLFRPLDDETVKGKVADIEEVLKRVND